MYPKNTQKLLGAKIRALRKQQKLSQEKLSELINITPRQMVRIEMGQSFPTIDNIEHIAIALGVEVFDLFNNKSYDDIDNLKKQICKKLNSFDEKTIRFLFTVIQNL